MNNANSSKFTVICNFTLLLFCESIKVCYLTFDIKQSIIVGSKIASTKLKQTWYLQTHIQGKCHYILCVSPTNFPL